MTLKEINEKLNERSARLSEITRQLGLAGIALIWLFKQDIAGQPAIPKGLYPAGICIVLGLGLDLFQYVVATHFWINLHDQKTRELRNNFPDNLTIQERSQKNKEIQEIELDYPIKSLQRQEKIFWFKISSIIVAYGFLFAYLVRNLIGI